MGTAASRGHRRREHVGPHGQKAAQGQGWGEQGGFAYALSAHGRMEQTNSNHFGDHVCYATEHDNALTPKRGNLPKEHTKDSIAAPDREMEKGAGVPVACGGHGCTGPGTAPNFQTISPVPRVVSNMISHSPMHETSPATDSREERADTVASPLPCPGVQSREEE